jgi:adenine-specific DNA-methyltransferase
MMGSVVALKRKSEKQGVLPSTQRLPLSDVSARALAYPELRYMGSKKRLLPWIGQVMDGLDFESALDPFSGTGSVGYLMKTMDRRVVASDFLNFSSMIARATIENNVHQLDGRHIKKLLSPAKPAHDFIQRTFGGVFYKAEDLKFLDRVSGTIRQLDHPHHQALAYAALFRACLKRQPRGVFTVSGDLSRYDDGRRDLKLSVEEHFIEQIEVFNQAVFSNGRRNKALRSDVFDLPKQRVDLVYLDPPYVPRSDDNCYIKRYHFLEGLASYWHGLPVNTTTKVKKIDKRFTPFSYRRTAIDAFDQLFSRFAKSTIVLSYSSNGFPDLEHLETLLRRYKKSVRVFEKSHRYHFGTHEGVERSSVTEYLIVGQ